MHKEPTRFPVETSPGELPAVVDDFRQDPNILVSVVNGEFELDGKNDSIAVTNGSTSGLSQELRVLVEAGSQVFGVCRVVNPDTGKTYHVVSLVGSQEGDRGRLIAMLDEDGNRKVRIGKDNDLQGLFQGDQRLSGEHFSVELGDASGVRIYDHSRTGTFVGVAINESDKTEQNATEGVSLSKSLRWCVRTGDVANAISSVEASREAREDTGL